MMIIINTNTINEGRNTSEDILEVLDDTFQKSAEIHRKIQDLGSTVSLAIVRRHLAKLRSQGRIETTPGPGPKELLYRMQSPTTDPAAASAGTCSIPTPTLTQTSSLPQQAVAPNNPTGSAVPSRADLSSHGDEIPTSLKHTAGHPPDTDQEEHDHA